MFTFDHPLGKPLEPLEGGLPLDILADSLDVIPQLKPGLDDRPVVGIIDHAQSITLTIEETSGERLG